MKSSLYLLLSILIMSACTNSAVEDFQPDYRYDYFPTTVGKWISYDVDSIIYDFSADSTSFISDTATYQLREIVVDSFTDNLGRTAFKVERERRENSSESWVVQDVISYVRTATRAEVIEENRRFVKLLFPPKRDSIWDGNQYFDTRENVVIEGETVEMFKSWEYKVLSLDSTETIGGLTFDNTLTLQLADDENLIEKRLAIEKYARGVGLIYKEYWILDTQCISDCIGQSWEEKAEKGFILRMKVRNFN